MWPGSTTQRYVLDTQQVLSVVAFKAADTDACLGR
jgi:hypothetical protein